jgi:hypothetical protein
MDPPGPNSYEALAARRRILYVDLDLGVGLCDTIGVIVKAWF